MKNIKAVLFDLDCTLIDRHRTIDAYGQQFIEDFHDELADHNLATVLPVLHKADGGGYRMAERSSEILGALSWHAAPTADRLDAHWRQHTPAMAVLMESAMETLRACRARDLALAIVTNGTVNSQQRKLDALGLAAEVDAVVISEAVGCKKPDPRIFAAALERLDVSAAETVYVGDHPVNDVMGATQAGLQAIWLSGWHPWPEDWPPNPWVAGSLPEVVDLLSRRFG